MTSTGGGWRSCMRIWANQRRVYGEGDRKSTRLNSSHLVISYAVFCLKKKKKSRRVARYHEARNSRDDRSTETASAPRNTDPDSRLVSGGRPSHQLKSATVARVRISD